jgi:hypothetical protein
VSELKARQPRSLPARRTVKELVADGFEERQRKRQQRRDAFNAKTRGYNARMKELEAALAAKRNSAITSATAAVRAKLPTTKAAGGKS